MIEAEAFIHGLEKEHAMIGQAFKKLEPVLKNGDINNIEQVLDVIEQLKTILINHLKDEDKRFYPDMKQRAIELGQDALLPALNLFIVEMEQISGRVFSFFSKFGSRDAILDDQKGFIDGIAEIRDALIKRITTEEKTLYYIYRAYHNL